MLSRRSLIGAGLSPLLLTTHASAAGLADALDRPAAPMRLASKPSMLAITRAGDRLVAVGERGVVLLSDDDGSAWRQARVPTSVTLTAVQFVGAQRGWALGHSGLVLHSSDGGQTWNKQLDGIRIAAAMRARADELQRAGPGDAAAVSAASQALLVEQDGPDKPLFALHFSDENRGWVVGAYGLALMTTDGGRSWRSRAEVLPNPKGKHFYALARIGDQLIVAGEQGLLVSLGADGAAGSATLLPTPYRGSFFAMAALANEGLLLGGLRGTVLLRQRSGEFNTLDSGTTRAIVSIARLADQQVVLVDQGGRLAIGLPSAGSFAPQPFNATRRWVSIAVARDGTLIGAGHSGVERLAGPAPNTQRPA